MMLVLRNSEGEVIKEMPYGKETNFDRITASPEALAEFIRDITIDCYGCRAIHKTSCVHFKKYLTCFCEKDDVLDWLKQEV